MEFWVEVARGPAFRAALVFLILGLLRRVLLAVWEAAGARHRTVGSGEYGMAGLFDLRDVWHRVILGLTTVTFCVSLIVVAVLLRGHVALWKAATGVSWPAISNPLADALTGVAVATALLLVVERGANREFRRSSTITDYLFPLVVAAPLLSGFLLMHPAWNPFGYAVTTLVHALSADLLLTLVPIVRLTRIPAADLPLLFLSRWREARRIRRIATDLGWKGVGHD